MKSPLTSVADGGRSSWSLSVIRATELSVRRSAGVRRCCCPRCRSPGARQQAHKRHSKIVFDSTPQRKVSERHVFCKIWYIWSLLLMGFTAFILFFFGEKPDTKISSEQPDLWLPWFWGAAETQGLQLILLCQETSSYVSVHKQRKIPCLSDKYASIAHFYAMWKRCSVLLCTPVGKSLTFSPVGWITPILLSLCRAQNSFILLHDKVRNLKFNFVRFYWYDRSPNPILTLLQESEKHLWKYGRRFLVAYCQKKKNHNSTLFREKKKTWQSNIRYTMESLNWFGNICVSPAPANCRACSPPSRAGCRLCPGCLGCEEPGWRQPSPQPEPKVSPVSLCPWRGTEEEVRQQKKVKTDVQAAPVVPGRFGSGGRWKKGCRAGPVCGWRSCWCSGQANFSGSDILAWPYIHLAAGRKAPGDAEKDATVRGEMRDRIKEGLATNMRLNQVHLAGSGH